MSKGGLVWVGTLLLTAALGSAAEFEADNKRFAEIRQAEGEVAKARLALAEAARVLEKAEARLAALRPADTYSGRMRRYFNTRHAYVVDTSIYHPTFKREAELRIPQAAESHKLFLRGAGPEFDISYWAVSAFAREKTAAVQGLHPEWSRPDYDPKKWGWEKLQSLWAPGYHMVHPASQGGKVVVPAIRKEPFNGLVVEGPAFDGGEIPLADELRMRTARAVEPGVWELVRPDDTDSLQFVWNPLSQRMEENRVAPDKAIGTPGSDVSRRPSYCEKVVEGE